MKDYKRLAAGVALGNTPEGAIVANVINYGGGPFELQPRMDSDGVWLVDVNRPSGYGFKITGEPDALGRLGRALLTLERNADDNNEDSTPDVG